MLGERHGLLLGGGGQEHPSGQSAAAALAEDVLAVNHDADGVILFGELFGGRYSEATEPHSDHTRPVQQGIWYSPRIEWMVFDIALRTATGGRFLPYNVVVQLAARHGFFCATPLRIDTYQRCLDYPARFLTTIPRALHSQRQHADPLPALIDNLAEGIVVKPWDVATAAANRPILKFKIEEFSEGGGQPPADASGAALRAYMLGLVNSNRLAAAFSKIGPPPPSGRSHKQWAARVATMATEDCLDTIGDADTGRLFRDQLYCKALGIINNEAPN